MQQFLQFIILTSIRSSTRFVRPHARHWGLDCSSSLWFYLRIVVIAVLLFVFEHERQHGYHHDAKVKPEAATAVVEPSMTRVKTHETCRAANKRQDNKLEKLLHLVGDLFELLTIYFHTHIFSPVRDCLFFLKN